MSRRLLAVICGLLLVFSVSAVGFANEVTLTVWESTGGPDEFIKQAGEAFTKLYPHIKINYVNVELGDSTGQIAWDGPAGVGPDLFAAPMTNWVNWLWAATLCRPDDLTKWERKY